MLPQIYASRPDFDAHTGFTAQGRTNLGTGCTCCKKEAAYSYFPHLPYGICWYCCSVKGNQFQTKSLHNSDNQAVSRKSDDRLFVGNNIALYFCETLSSGICCSLKTKDFRRIHLYTIHGKYWQNYASYRPGSGR